MLVIAVDGGGSGSRGAIADDHEIVARAEAGPLQLTTVPPARVEKELDALLDELVRKAGVRRVDAVCLGLAGAGSAVRREPAERWARSRLGSSCWCVCRDVDLVLAAGGAGGVGIAVVVGTGAIVVGRGADGIEHRADGWGPLVGDRGGGFDLALNAIRDCLRELDETGTAVGALAAAICETLNIARVQDAAAVLTAAGGVPFVTVAGVARRVCDLAESGDAQALRLVAAGAAELAASYRAVRRRLHDASEIPHLLAGGLATAPSFRDAFLADVGDGPSWQEVRDPLAGGLVIARADARSHAE